MRITDQDRITAREEHAHKPKMSASATRRLRKLAEERERDAEAEARFIEEFGQLKTDSWTMRQVLQRICRPANEASMTTEEVNDWFDRRALKLRRCLAIGWKPQDVHDIVFFAELTSAEAKMSADEFYESMTSNWPEAKPVEVLSDRQKIRQKSLWKSTTWGAAKPDLRRTGHAMQVA